MTKNRAYGMRSTLNSTIHITSHEPQCTPVVPPERVSGGGGDAPQLLMARVITLGYGITSANVTAVALGFDLDKSKQYVCQFQEQSRAANFTAGGLLSWGDMPDYPLEYAISNGFLSLLLVDYLMPAVSFSQSATALSCGTLDNVATFAKARVGRGGLVRLGFRVFGRVQGSGFRVGTMQSSFCVKDGGWACEV